MRQPVFLVKVIPHVDGTQRVLELVNCKIGRVKVREAWSGRASLLLNPHCFSDMHELPVMEVLSAVHFVADLSIENGEVVHNDLAS
nr:acetoacetate decarboxylase family protein [Pseudomonas sp. MWU16-30317]